MVTRMLSQVCAQGGQTYPRSCVCVWLCLTLFRLLMECPLTPSANSRTPARSGIIYLAELTDDDETRLYALKSIAAFVLEDLGLAAPRKNSRRVPHSGDIPFELQTIWL